MLPFLTLVYSILTANAFKQVQMENLDTFKLKLVNNSDILGFPMKHFDDSRSVHVLSMKKGTHRRKPKMIHY